MTNLYVVQRFGNSESESMKWRSKLRMLQAGSNDQYQLNSKHSTYREFSSPACRAALAPKSTPRPPSPFLAHPADWEFWIGRPATFVMGAFQLLHPIEFPLWDSHKGHVNMTSAQGWGLRVPKSTLFWGLEEAVVPWLHEYRPTAGDGQNQ